MLEENIKKPHVVFTSPAWLKMKQLVMEATTEIGWQGVVIRQDNFFLIKDILVYPQTVTGATVTTDEIDYSKWLMGLDDHTFAGLRMQGHSHVNMHTSPSGVDENFYNNILQTLQKDEYYIFMILNKRDDIFIQIYDYAQNIIFEKADIVLSVKCKDGTISSWAKKQIAEHVKTHSYLSTLNTNTTTTSAISDYLKNDDILAKFRAEKDKPTTDKDKNKGKDKDKGKGKGKGKTSKTEALQLTSWEKMQLDAMGYTPEEIDENALDQLYEFHGFSAMERRTRY